MPSAAENALINALTDIEALEELVRQDLDPACIPTPKLAEIITWATKYFLISGRKQAPGRAELMASWGAALEAMGAELDAEDVQQPHVIWAVQQLRHQHAHVELQQILVDTAAAAGAANVGESTEVARVAANRMFALATATSNVRIGGDASGGVEASIARFERRRDNPEAMRGLGFGLPTVDQYTGGIQRSQVGTVIAPEKTGKSYLGLYAGLKHFQSYDDSITVVFSLENDPEVQFDRLACVACRIDHDRYRRGEITTQQLEVLKAWSADNAKDLAERLFILQPAPGSRSADALCQEARARGADAVILDQLSHVEIGRRYHTDREETKRAMIELVDAVKESHGDPLSMLLLSQASRAAAEAAKKTGTLGSHAGAGTSEIERASDMVCGLLQTGDDAEADEAVLEMLAFRHGSAKAKWQLRWRPWVGDVQVYPQLVVRR